MEVKEDAPEAQDDFHGVLRYGRESDWKKLSALSTSPSSNDLTVWCEFCGAKARPPLDFSKSPDAEDFCCIQYMELFKKVEQQWHLLQEHSGEASQDQDSNEEHRNRTRPQDLFQQFADCLRKSRRQANQNDMPGCKVTSSGLFTTITFRLSDFIRSKASRRSTAREDAIDEDKHMAASLCSSLLPARFGLCLYQGYIQKFYSNRNRFLTTFPDGTARVLYAVNYPSGNLAIITFADDTEGVCVVLEDNGPIRAFFQSSGIATCYHSNGKTWLHMDKWGGRTLNQDLSKRTRWKWTDYMNKPTPFKPLYMSLNKNVGVRVRGRDSVMVTFLASGKQACFRVGSSIKPSEPMPSLDTEDLMLQVCQLNARMALERLRWCLAFQSRCRKFPSGLITQGRRLLRLSADMYMEENDKAYIQHCLQDCQ